MYKSFRKTAVSGFAWIVLGACAAHAGLVHEWNFNETSGTNFQDTVGSANARVVVQAGGGGFQLNGQSVRLDGGARATADYISLPGDVFDGLTNVTIEIWAEPHSFPNWGRVIDMGTGDAAPNPTTDNFRLSFSVDANGNQQRFGLRPFAAVDSALNTPVDQLYHYAIVWSATGGAGGQARIDWYRDGTYVTGQDVGTSTIAVIANLPQTAIWLGRSPFTIDMTANASYHAMRIYNEALDPAVIALHTLAGPDNTGPDGVDGLLHRYSFSEITGPAVADSVGSANGQVIVPGVGGGTHTFAGGQLRLFGGAKGTSDYVAFPAGLLDGLTDATIEVWATPVSAMNWSRIWDFGSGVDNVATWFLSFSQGVDINFQRMEFTPYTINTALPTNLGEEHHFVGIWSSTGGPGGGGRMAWYRDGVLAGEIDTSTTTVSAVNDAAFWIGRSSWPDDTANAFFNEMRIYNRALTPAEINFNRLNGPDNVTIPAPEAVDDFMTLNPGAIALIPVLANDQGSTVVPSTLEVVNPPSFGSAVVKPGGKILYTHNGGPSTSDQFTYRVQNSTGVTSEVANVFITVDAALRLPNTTVSMPASPPPVTYQIVDAFPGLFFEDALAIHTPPGVTNQIFVVERRGRISYVPDIHAANPARQVFLDITGRVFFDDSAQGESGLLGMAFHPGFATNGYVYVFYTAPGSPYFEVLSRFTSNPSTLITDPNSEQKLFDVVDQGDPCNCINNHNGGDLHFGPDGYLYIGMGDEGGQFNARDNAQRIDKDLFSSMLRIDVDKKPGSVAPRPSANTTTIHTNALGQAFYGIPPNNPFVGATSYLGQPINTNTLRAEIFATGFRHIWRFSIDSLTGDVWVGEVGQDRWEEVNIVTNGGNYGWKFYEGYQLASPLYPGQANLAAPPPGFVHSEPVYVYPHAGTGGDPNFSGDSISGGIVYRGNRFPELYGAYLFADFEFQNVWVLRRNGTNVTVERIGADLGIAAFGTDPSNGDVLFANYFQNSIKRLVRADASNGVFPQKLSDTGVFADLQTLAPNPGIVSYEPKIAFWSDYAIKRRWFMIPDLTNKVTFEIDTNWTLPSGMVWIKHFDLESERGNTNSSKRRLETRLLVKNDGGNYGVSYRWNDAQTEAFLVADGGDVFNVAVTVNGAPTNQMWEIPSRAGCLACHTVAGGHALSFNTRQMNHTSSLNGHLGNQIDLLAGAGYLNGSVPPSHILPVLAAAGDINASLEFRARSYLAVNCVQCHQAGGIGGGIWDARPQLTLDQTKMINGPLDLNGGDPANKVIVPGDTNHSVLLRRIKADGFSRMPPLATHQLDQQAIGLLTAWIGTDLTNRQNFAQWQVANFGSTNNPSAAAGVDPDNDGANNYYEFLTMTPPQSNSEPWAIGIDESSGTVGVNFLRLANRAFLVETAPDFINWTPWNVPGNQLYFGASDEFTSIIGPLLPGETNRFFRVKIFEP